MADKRARRPLRAIVRPVEGAAAQALFRALRVIPLDAASGIGGAVARTVGPLLPLSRRARRNLARCFPEMTPAAIDACVREMWDNLGRLAAEAAHLSGLHGAAARGRIETIGAEHVDAALKSGRPAIFFTGHLANWEIGALAMKACGAPLHVVYRPANNPAVERIYRATRLPVAAAMIPKGPRGTRMIMEVMRTRGQLGMLIDQKMNDGIPVPFFGREAMTAPALARLAIRYDCTVLPVQVERLEGARFRVTVHPPLVPNRTGDLHRDILDFMTRANAILESWIRQRPGQWLWLHRRWPD